MKWSNLNCFDCHIFHFSGWSKEIELQITNNFFAIHGLVVNHDYHTNLLSQKILMNLGAPYGKFMTDGEGCKHMINNK